MLSVILRCYDGVPCFQFLWLYSFGLIATTTANKQDMRVEVGVGCCLRIIIFSCSTL